jgi:hypothetical protein
MNWDNLRLTEACLFHRKRLPREIGDLEAEMETIMPPSPGSVLKMQGRPQAKAPGDPSQTETWGIIRATCPQSEQLAAKRWLYQILTEVRLGLDESCLAYTLQVYDKELPGQAVRRRLSLSHRQYYRLRDRVLRYTWSQICNAQSLIELALQPMND